MTYITRTIEPTIRKAAELFPVVVLTGPRQSGKTTLLRHLFGQNHRYASLEAPDVRAAAISDPRRFLEMNPAPIIFDEIQHVPELLPYIKELVDTRRDQTGQFLLTGSQNLLLAEKVTESLAGRAGILRLLPLSHPETMGEPNRSGFWEGRTPIFDNTLNAWPSITRGAFPELIANPGHDANLWHASYVQTYLERDVRLLRQIGDLTLFQSFLRALALRSGQLLNIADIARDLGVAMNTAKAWIAILEATFQIVLLRPYFRNATKRLVKRPKVFFTDTGTLCYLAGLRNEWEVRNNALSGAVFETAVLTDIIKAFVHRGEEPRIYFWRTSDGAEVDFLIETGGKLIPVEVKSATTSSPAMAKGIHTFREQYGEDLESEGYVIYGGDKTMPIGPRIIAIPFAGM